MTSGEKQKACCRADTSCPHNEGRGQGKEKQRVGGTEST